MRASIRACGCGPLRPGDHRHSARGDVPAGQLETVAGRERHLLVGAPNAASGTTGRAACVYTYENASESTTSKKTTKPTTPIRKRRG